ncbi:hypothetical protein BDN72DRAFT_46188 [Pluteus cervinus]|uniref:Uncharacterized protein n=1 Tax=Pluteus cervinus TaxID=181527 RepID=A0ACD3BGZ7_9AGAR|nr:hypothetical protein BDN72DRAFT_46188 [Pluteus cervinus]
MLDHKRLPPELWIEIFHWVAFDHALNSSGHPFQRTLCDTRQSRQLRATLSVVCREWHHLASDVLYKDLVVNHGSPALLRVLKNSQTNICDRVRSITLPYSSTATAPYLNSESSAIHILKLCKGVQTLVRPRPDTQNYKYTFESDALVVPLPSLQRLDWWYSSEAERSGGINSLDTVLRNAPNIQYLFIGGFVGTGYGTFSRTEVTLPFLHTLRFHMINGFLLRQVLTCWNLPSLSRIIVDTPLLDGGVSQVLEKFGHQLRSVELGRHIRFFLFDYLSMILRDCPSLENIDFYLFFTMPPKMPPGLQYPSVTTIGLNTSLNPFLESTKGESWELLGKHFNVFSGSLFPNLKRVLLYGDWSEYLTTPQFTGMETKLLARGCSVENASIPM